MKVIGVNYGSPGDRDADFAVAIPVSVDDYVEAMRRASKAP
jgi:hypothetical protein